MSRARQLQTNFTAGELSPRVYGRVDLARYSNGAAAVENMLVDVQGGVTRRRGTYYIAPVKSGVSGIRRLVRFEVSTIASYVLEFGAGYIRFYQNRGQLESGGSPVEVATPYTEAHLRELRFAQSADVLYICHVGYEPRKLVRTSATSFSLSAITFLDGPWQAENDSTVTLTPSARGGSITVTASAPLFQANNVGQLLALYDEAPERAAASATVAGQMFFSYYAGTYRLYVVVVAGTTAAANLTSGVEPPYDKNAPIEESDYVRDGTAVLRYIGRGKSAWGWGIITAYTSSTQVTVGINGVLAGTNATTRWKVGEWGGGRGYPRCMTFHAGRTVWGGSLQSPQTIWTSETGDFESMTPYEQDGAVLDTNAITVSLDDDRLNVITWMASFQRGLFIGAAGGEFVINPTNQNAALSPENIRADRKGDRGSSTVVPGQRAGTAVLFVTRSNQKLRELVYDFGTDSFKANDLTVLAEHITGDGIVDLARQDDPNGILWAVREDGALLSLTYDQDQEVRAWCRHIIGGADVAVESVAVVPDPDGVFDDVYLVVRRTIGGTTVRYVEWMGRPFDGSRDDAVDAFCVDSGLTYDGVPATTFSGLAHLNGQTVAICADGAERPTAVVSGGAVTIAAPAASVVHIGLPYTSRVRFLRPEFQTQEGPAQGQKQRIVKATLRLHETMGGSVVRNGVVEPLLYRTPPDLMTQAVPLFSGDYEVSVGGGWDRGTGLLQLQTSAPLPFTLLAAIYEVAANA